MLENKKIGFIGAGVMAKAIIKGLIKSEVIPKENITVSEISMELAQKASHELGITVISNNKDIVKGSDIIILCIKPFSIENAVKEIKDSLNDRKLLVSIAAGVSTQIIETLIEKIVPVIRVMPNTPSLVGEGMSAVCRGSFANEKHLDIVIEIFKAVGKCVEVSEKFINTVTGISGSGPAFFYYIIEAMADAGLKLGLRKDVALKLSAQTALGAAKMILETGKPPSVLKDEVTTPGGCTIAGLFALENENVRQHIIKAVIETANTASKLD
jgi:pyrroline-5-carboxylate reductase